MLSAFPRGCLALAVVTLIALVSCGAVAARPLRVAINAGPEGDAVRAVYKECSNGAQPAELVPFAYSSLREQLISALSRDQDRFDVIMIDDPWFPQLAPWLLTLKDVPPALLDDIVGKSLELSKEPYGTGELKALPYVGNTQLLFLRKDLLAAEGIKAAPETWDEVVSLAKRLTDPSHDRYGYAIRGRAGAPIVTDFLPIYWSLGGTLTDVEDGRQVSKLNIGLFKRALETYRALEQASPPGAINFDWPEMTAAFTNGRAVMELNWPAAIPDIQKALAAAQRPNAWEVRLPPRGSPNGNRTSMIGNWLLGIPRASRNAGEAEKFIVCLMDHQDQVASEGRPPTRKSVFAALAQSKPYFNDIEQALELSTPRDRTPKWSRIEDAVSRAVTSYLVRPDDMDSLVKGLEADLNRILR